MIGGTGSRASTLSPSLRLVVMLRRPSGGPRRAGELLPCHRRGAAVDGAFFGSDAIQGAALSRMAALTSAFADVHAHEDQ